MVYCEKILVRYRYMLHENEANQLITCRFSKFLIQLCKKKRFLWGFVLKYYFLGGSCRNITVPRYWASEVLCRALFRGCAEILVLRRNIHLWWAEHNITKPFLTCMIFPSPVKLWTIFSAFGKDSLTSSKKTPPSPFRSLRLRSFNKLFLSRSLKGALNIYRWSSVTCTKIFIRTSIIPAGWKPHCRIVLCKGLLSNSSHGRRGVSESLRLFLQILNN